MAKRTVKVWETRTISLPLPLWHELEKRFGETKSRKNAVAWWSGGRNFIAKSIFTCLLDMPGPMCDWLESRYKVMSDTFKVTGSQEQAEAAMMDFKDNPKVASEPEPAPVPEELTVPAPVDPACERQVAEIARLLARYQHPRDAADVTIRYLKETLALEPAPYRFADYLPSSDCA